jgi:hypothetical protein
LGLPGGKSGKELVKRCWDLWRLWCCGERRNDQEPGIALDCGTSGNGETLRSWSPGDIGYRRELDWVSRYASSVQVVVTNV